MDLVQPQLGLIFWTTLIFILLVLILKKYAWSPILTAVDKRNKDIEESLKLAEKAKEEMAQLTAGNEKIIQEAKKEREALLKDARETKRQIIDDAKSQANKEADKIIVLAKDQITNEKLKAITELKNHVAGLSIEMAEKIVKSELSEKEKHKKFIEKTLQSKEFN